MIRMSHFVKYLMLLTLTSSSMTVGDPLKACDLALEGCKKVVEAQDESIKHLKANVAELQTELVKAKENERVMPDWMLLSLAALAGFAVGSIVAK